MHAFSFIHLFLGISSIDARWNEFSFLSIFSVSANFLELKFLYSEILHNCFIHILILSSKEINRPISRGLHFLHAS